MLSRAKSALFLAVGVLMLWNGAALYYTYGKTCEREGEEGGGRWGGETTEGGQRRENTTFILGGNNTVGEGTGGEVVRNCSAKHETKRSTFLEEYDPTPVHSEAFYMIDSFLFRNNQGAITVGIIAEFKPEHKEYIFVCTFPSNETAAGRRDFDPHAHSEVVEFLVPSKDIDMAKQLGYMELQVHIQNINYNFIAHVRYYPVPEKPIYNLAGSMRIIYQAETTYVLEWILYHKILGYEHFFIYDSYGGAKTSLLPLIEAGLVTYIPWFMNGKAQIVGQNHALYLFGKSFCNWLSFNDVDEYMYPVQGTSLLPVLERYNSDPNKIGCVRVLNWDFGNQKSQETGLSFEVYRHRADAVTLNKREKCIVHPNYVIYYSVHQITLGERMVVPDAVNEVRMYHFYARNHPTRCDGNCNAVFDQEPIERYGGLLRDQFDYYKQLKDNYWTKSASAPLIITNTTVP